MGAEVSLVNAELNLNTRIGTAELLNPLHVLRHKLVQPAHLPWTKRLGRGGCTSRIKILDLVELFWFDMERFP